MGNIFLYILSVLISLFTIFLIIVYIKSDTLKSYPCFFNIYFCIIITLDNVIRLIPAKETETVENASFLCKAQAFILSIFDKLFIISITSFSIINYIFMSNPELYGKKAKFIYIILVLISICLSIILTIIFFKKGISKSSLEDSVCYVKTGDKIKIYTDSIFTIILLLIDIFCIIRILFIIFKNIKDCELKHNEVNKKKLKKHFWRFIIDLFLNIITFGFILAIINKKLNFQNEKKYIKDAIYIILCFFCELFFTINDESYREMLRIITCNKVEKYKNNSQNLLSEQPEEENNNEDND